MHVGGCGLGIKAADAGVGDPCTDRLACLHDGERVDFWLRHGVVKL